MINLVGLDFKINLNLIYQLRSYGYHQPFTIILPSYLSYIYHSQNSYKEPKILSKDYLYIVIHLNIHLMNHDWIRMVITVAVLKYK